MMVNSKQQVYRRTSKRDYFISENRGIPIYDTYWFSKKESIVTLLICSSLTTFFCYFFYRSLWSGIFLWPIGLYLYYLLKKQAKLKKSQKLELEFRDCIMSVSANLRAGYSIENAFIESRDDMHILYGKNSLIVKELNHIQKGIRNNLPLEIILSEMGERSGNSKVKEFAEVFKIARKSGGNMPDIIRDTVQLISEEISVKQDIQVMLSGRILEQRIMTVIPFLMVIYIELTNPGFFDVLYHNMGGWTVMTISLLIYIIAFLLLNKLCKI